MLGSILVSLAILHPAPLAARPVIVGYLPVFKGPEAIAARAPIERYTHLNLAFANPDAAGAFIDGGRLICMADDRGAAMTVDRLRRLVDGLKARGGRVLVSLGGGVIPGCSGDWAALLRPERRAAVVANLVDLVERTGLDGIDVDIEGTLLTAIDRAGDYTPFIAALADAMTARGKLLTCATASYEGGMIPVASIRHFDLVTIMSYDAIGPTWGTAGDEHSTLAGARRDLALWRQRGVPPDRLVLGVPFYGYGFGRYSPNLSFHEVRAGHPRAARGDLVGRACAGCDYVTFNGPRTIRRKSALARGSGGVMVWEISQDGDDDILLDAIEDGLGTDRPN